MTSFASFPGFVLAGTAGLLLQLPALAQGNQEDPAELRTQIRKALEDRKALKRPVVVNGIEIHPLEVMRQTLYRVGQVQIRKKMIEMVLDEQMALAIEEGRKKKADFAILEDEIRKVIEKNRVEYAKKYPDKDFEEALATQGITLEEYVTLTRTTLLFDRIFFPGVPSKWPEITKDCIIAAGGPQGTEFFRKLEDSVKEGQAVPPFFLQICRKWVLSQLEKWSDVQYASDGLAYDDCFSLNGRAWKTRDAARVLALKMKPVDYQNALSELALWTAVKQELQAAGTWLDAEAFKREFDEYKKPYEGSPFSVKMIAMSFKGYPTYEVYKQRWRLERSFEHMIEKEINDDSLGKHMLRASQFLNDGKVSVHLIRIPAWDDKIGTWKKDGFATARKQASEVMDRIADKSLSFDEAMRQHAKWPEHIEHQGFIGPKGLNELRQELKESEYTDFISGYSVANELFYNGKAGNVAGPLRGQDGYYIGFIASRTPPTGKMDLTNKDQRDLVKQDYVSFRFLQWANEVASRTKVSMK